MALPDGVSGWVRVSYYIIPTVLCDNPIPTIRIPGMDILMDILTINKVLGVPHISNTEFISRFQEKDIKWLRDTLVLEEFREQD